MRKGRNGEKKKRGGKKGKKKKRRMKIVATTSLPAVDCPNADRWNAARSRQYVGVISVLRTRFTWDLSQISVWCFRYTWDKHDICLRYACDDLLKTENVQPLVDSRNMHVQDMIWGYHWSLIFRIFFVKWGIFLFLRGGVNFIHNFMFFSFRL